MQTIPLTKTEQNKLEVIQAVMQKEKSKLRAAVELGCTLRHINRMIQGYRNEKEAFFVHGNRGRKPAHAIDQEVKKKIVTLYQTKYEGTNFTHFSELLSRHEQVTISTTTIHSTLSAADILSPKARRITKRNQKKLLKAKKEQATSMKEKAQLEAKILELHEAHPRRPRCSYFGEMQQLDASEHLWFGLQKTHLHVAIDDATGSITGAYFDTQETLHAYYHVLDQVLCQYGIPYRLFTDRRTVFEYKQKKSPSTEEDTFTQFSYACSRLGIDLKTSSIPQAKGRVERMFQTLQSRLPFELALAGVTTIAQANAFLNSYIKELNTKFALPIDHIKSVFETQPDQQTRNRILSVLTPRKIDAGHSIRFNNKYYRLLDDNGSPVYYRKGTECLVIKAFDGQMLTSIEDRIFALDEIPKHAPYSKELDPESTAPKLRKPYIPPLDHPWRLSVFKKHLSSQPHRTELAI